MQLNRYWVTRGFFLVPAIPAHSVLFIRWNTAGNPGPLCVKESLFNPIQIVHLEISPERCEEYGQNMLRHFNFFEIRWRAIVIWAYWKLPADVGQYLA